MDALKFIKELFKRIALYNDAVAYKELFLYYHQKLIRFSYTIVSSKETAEEVVSDVFLKLWLNRVSLLHINNPQLYIYSSVKNQSLTRLHKEKRNQFFSYDEIKVEMESLYYDPEQLMCTSELFNNIKLAIQSLPPKCQFIFKLIKEDGLRYKEVAELLHLSPKTIENQMSIAIKKIGASINLNIKKTAKEIFF